MPTTVTDLVEDTRRHLYGSVRMDMNRLQTEISDVGAATLTAEFDLQGIVRSGIIGINDEIMYVLSAVPTSRQVTVLRGFLGSTPAVHAAGSIIEVNPRFPREYIKEALKREINSWGPRLFRVTGHDVAVGTTGVAYDMPVSDYYHVVDIRSRYTTETARPLLRGFSIARDYPIAEFPSGSALLLPQAPAVGTTLRVRIARPFDTSTFDNDTDVEADVGLATSMVDIPSIGAAYRLLSTREIPRTNMSAQPEPRRAEEVPPGHISSVVRQLEVLRNTRMAEEQFLLRERYPYRIS